MDIRQHDLTAATQIGLISNEQAQKLWQFWQQQRDNSPQFRFSHVMYYFGGLLAISAVTLFVTKAWDQLQGLPLLIISLLLFALGLTLTHYFLKKKLAIPAGIIATFSLALIPLATYNLQLLFGFVPQQHYHYVDYHYWINWYWVPMELTTLFVGIILFYCYRFPFILFPIAVTLWYLSMDLYSLLLEKTDFSHRSLFTIVFGLIVLLIAWILDKRHQQELLRKPTKQLQDYAFWLYLFGVIIFWGGLSLQSTSTELNQVFYCVINVVMIFVGVWLNRRVFTIFGALGIFGYLSHLAFSVFANSLLFSIVLMLLGFFIIFLAIYWVQRETKIRRVFARRN